MKKVFYFLILLIFSNEVYAQTWDWKYYHSHDYPVRTLQDINKNVYLFSYDNSINALNFKLELIDPNGKPVWMENSTGIQITAFDIDANNDLVILGNLNEKCALFDTVLTPLGAESFFIAKVSTAGHLINAKVYGSTNKATANDIYINKNNQYLIGGGFIGTFEFNDHTIDGDSLQNGFIVKMDSDGRILWHQEFSSKNGFDNAEIHELIETASGKIYTRMWSHGGSILQLDSFGHFNWQNNPLFSMELESEYWDMRVFGETLYMKEEQHPHSSGVAIARLTESGLKSSRMFNYTGLIGYALGNEQVYYAYSGASKDPNYSDVYFFSKIGTLSPELLPTPPIIDSIATTENYLTLYWDMLFLDSSHLLITGNDRNPFVGKLSLSEVTSTQEKDMEGITIFPNPGNAFTINNKSTNSPMLNLTVIDSYGRVILKDSLENIEGGFGKSIDLSREAKGIYFVEIQSGQQKKIKKIVVE